MPPNHPCVPGLQARPTLHKGITWVAASRSMRRNRMRPNPLGSTISTAMTINTLVVLLLRPRRGWRDFAIRDGQVRFIHLHKPL